MRTSVFIALCALLGAFTLLSSCSTIWDPTAQQQAKESVIAITVASRIRNDPKPPQRENAYKAAVVVLDEFIASENTDSDELRKELYSGISKVLSPALSLALVDEIMLAVTDAAGSVKDPEKLLQAEKTIRNGISAGIASSAQPAVVTSSKK